MTSERKFTPAHLPARKGEKPDSNHVENIIFDTLEFVKAPRTKNDHFLNLLTVKYPTDRVKETIKLSFPVTFELRDGKKIEVDTHATPHQRGQVSITIPKGDDNTEELNNEVRELVVDALYFKGLLSNETHTGFRTKLEKFVSLKAAKQKAEELEARYKLDYGDTLHPAQNVSGLKR